MILITRPLAAAQRMAKALSQALSQAQSQEWPHLPTLIDPLVTLQGLDTRPPPVDTDAVIMTSINGFNFLKFLPFNKPVYCAGEASRQKAHTLGYHQVYATDGAHQIPPLLLQHNRQKIVWYHSNYNAFDFVAWAKHHPSVHVTPRLLYQATYKTHFNDDTVSALQSGTVTHITCFSQKMAHVLHTLMTHHGIDGTKFIYLCQSHRIATLLQNYGYHKTIVMKPLGLWYP